MSLPAWVRRHILYAPADDGAGSGDGKVDADDGKGGSGESIMDHATGDDGQGDDDKSDKGDGDTGDGESAAYDPGSLPGGVLGKTDPETIDNLLGTLKEARKAISQGKHKGAADVPDDAADYKIASTGDDDALALAVNGEESAEMLSVARDAASDAKLGKVQFETFVRAFMEKGGDVGMLMSDEEATKINGTAEMKELVASAGSEEAAGQIVNTVAAYFNRLKGLELVAETDRVEWNTMVGTARSASIMYRVLTDIAGFKPVPMTGQRGDSIHTAADAQALHAKALGMTEGSERTAELIRVRKIFDDVYGTEPASDSREAAARAAG